MMQELYLGYRNGYDYSLRHGEIDGYFYLFRWDKDKNIWKLFDQWHTKEIADMLIDEAVLNNPKLEDFKT